MTNPYYGETGNPPNQTRGLSASMRAEFVLIRIGFDGVTTTLAGKGAIAGQTWTGTHDFTGGTIKVPTLPYGTSGNYAVSWDALNAAIFASVAGFPAQTGNAGKVLMTDGSTPTWEFPRIPRSSRTSNAMLTAADCSSFIDITSGTFTQTLDTAANLGAGWYVRYRNSGTGEITITTDGVTYKIYSKEQRVIMCDGTNITSFVEHGYDLTITSAFVFTVPPGYNRHEGEAWSGGASGGAVSSTGTAINGGAGGGAFPFSFTPSQMGVSQTILIGSGGAGVTGSSGGGSGGNTSIGSLLTIIGAAQAASINGPSTGGAISPWAGSDGGGSGPSNGFGSPVANAFARVKTIWGGAITACGNSDTDGAPGDSIWGGASGGPLVNTGGAGTPIAGGTSLYGGNGGASSVTGNGVAGTAPGGGGGAVQGAFTSGAGARGEVRIRGRI